MFVRQTITWHQIALLVRRTTITRSIEIVIRHQRGDRNLPDPLAPQKGILM